MIKSLQMSIPNRKGSHRAPPPNNNILLTQTARPASAQPFPAPPGHAGQESLAEVIMVAAIVLFILGFLSLYARQCADRRTRIRGGGGNGGRRHHEEPGSLSPDVIESFPTFLYATVKGLMVAEEAFACPVCLHEFQDDEVVGGAEESPKENILRRIRSRTMNQGAFSGATEL